MSLKRYLKARKYLLLFLSIILIIGCALGLFLGISNIDALRYSVNSYVSNINNASYNYLYFHFFITVISVILSFFLIGVPFICATIFYEGMSIGFLIGIFSLTYGMNGFLFSFLFILLTKGIYIFLLYLLFSKDLQIARLVISKILYKTKKKDLLFCLIKSIVVIIILIVIYDFLILLLGSKITSFFSFLITS